MRITIESEAQTPVSILVPDQAASASAGGDGGSAPGTLSGGGTPGSDNILPMNAGVPSDELMAAIAAAPSPNVTPQGLDGGSAPDTLSGGGTPGSDNILTMNAGVPSGELMAAIAAAPSPNVTPQGLDGGSAPSL